MEDCVEMGSAEMIGTVPSFLLGQVTQLEVWEIGMSGTAHPSGASLKRNAGSVAGNGAFSFGS